MSAPNYTKRMDTGTAPLKPGQRRWFARARDRHEGLVGCWIAASILLTGYGSRALLGWEWPAVAAAWTVAGIGFVLYQRWLRNRWSER